MVWAINNPGPQSGSIGLEGTISSSPPSRGAVIAIPTNGSTFTSIPITVSGLCPSGLLVEVFDNNILVGSMVCSNGSYSIQIDLFNGQNTLVTNVYDALNQAGPSSNSVNVNFNSTQFSQFGTQLTLSSAYAEKGAPPGIQLNWPIVINGGTAPYALSVDWGDNSSTDLISEANAGAVNLTHTYRSAGIYTITIRATDKNGETAFLQLVGQATGAIQSNSKNTNAATTTKEEIQWWPAVALLPLIFIAFWAGTKHELDVIHKRYSGNS
jgi:hypothetical protein